MTQTASQIIDIDDVPRERLPRHVAVIMDGNGRWANQRGLPRLVGHREGGKSARQIITECGRLGIAHLTMYSFSVENWKRPAEEVDALMQLCVEYLAHERSTLVDNNVRLVQLGRREGLPPDVLRELDRTLEATSECTGLTLAVALNYGSRAEIIDAVQALARKVRTGMLEPEDIDEQVFSRHLYTAGLPDPDLLIRTGGEMRISNYLLWQISYAEFYVTDVLWPDFSRDEFHAALLEFTRRQRRFGAVDENLSDDQVS